MSEDSVSLESMNCDTPASCLTAVVTVAKKITKKRSKKDPVEKKRDTPHPNSELAGVSKKRKSSTEAAESSKKRKSSTEPAESSKLPKKRASKQSEASISDEEFGRQLEQFEKRSQALKRQLTVLRNQHLQLKAFNSQKLLDAATQSLPVAATKSLSVADEPEASNKSDVLLPGSGSGDNIAQQ